MKITESRLRKIIRDVISESVDDIHVDDDAEENEETSLVDLCSKQISEIRRALLDFEVGFEYLEEIRECYKKMGEPEDAQEFFDDLTHAVSPDTYYQAQDFKDAVALFKEELYNKI